jgi:hypothetical protein
MLPVALAAVVAVGGWIPNRALSVTTPQKTTTQAGSQAARLTAYILKRRPAAKPYAARLARAIITQSKRVGLDPAALAAVAWVESRYLRTAKGSAQEVGLYQLMRSDVRMAASWAKLRPTAPPWRSLSREAFTEALRDVEISTYLAADELAGVVAWCKRARHRVNRWQVGDPLGQHRHRYQIDRVAHHNSGAKWPRRGYLRALRYTYKQIRKVLNGR